MKLAYVGTSQVPLSIQDADYEHFINSYINIDNLNYLFLYTKYQIWIIYLLKISLNYLLNKKYYSSLKLMHTERWFRYVVELA